MFNSLNSGQLYVYFKNFHDNPLEQFVNYIKLYNGNINELFIIDYLTRKNDWFFKSGVNIVIFDYDNENEKGFLRCYNNIDPFYNFNIERPSIFLYYNQNYNMYEPIIKINSGFKIQSVFNYSDYKSNLNKNSKLINLVFEKIISNYDECFLSYKDKYTLNNYLNIIENSNLKNKKDLYPVIQYVNINNKVNFIGLENNIIIPVKESGPRENISIKSLKYLNNPENLNTQKIIYNFIMSFIKYIQIISQPKLLKIWSLINILDSY